MVTTAADLISQCKEDYLLAGITERRNKLAAPYTAGSGSLTLTYDLTTISAGATFAIGLNTFYVWSADSATKTAVVSGGHQQSVDADADTGDEVAVNPRYPDHRIFRALNQEIAALSAPRTGLFQVLSVELAYLNSATTGYDLTGVDNINSIIEVRYDLPSTGRSPRVPPGLYRLERNYDVSDSPSTFNLKLFDGTQGQDITVLYRAPFEEFSSSVTPLSSTGVPESMIDLLCAGAALRLLVGREIRRNDLAAQGDTRRPAEVPAGASANSWRGLAGFRAQRISEEASRLAAQYPVTR